MAAIAQQGAQWLKDQVAAIQHGEQLVRNQAFANAAELNRQWQLAAGEPDVGRQTAIKAVLRPLVAKQNSFASWYQGFSTRMQQLLDQARKFLNALAPTQQALGDLGVPQLLVPIVIVAAALVILKAIDWGKELTGLQAQALKQSDRVIGDPSLTPAQRTKALDDLNAILKQRPSGSDPLGLDQLLKDALPLIAILGAVLLLPPVLRALRTPGTRAEAA